MAEHHRLDRAVGDHGCGRRSAVEHADFAEELSRTQPGDRLAGPRHLHVAAGDDEEGFRWLAFGDHGLPRLQLNLVDAARQELEVAL